jgi:aminoacyl tRNA synthase complex-interacting multifunctional protein 1
VNYIPIEQMQDKWLIGVVGIPSRTFGIFSLTPFQCNLKPANMRGVKSFAMVLCVGGRSADKASVELKGNHFRRPPKMGKRAVSK